MTALSTVIYDGPPNGSTSTTAYTQHGDDIKMTNDHLDDYNDTDNNQLRALLDEAESNLEHAKSEQKLAYARGLIRAALMYTTSDPDTAADGIAALIHKEYTK